MRRSSHGISASSSYIISSRTERFTYGLRKSIDIIHGTNISIHCLGPCFNHEIRMLEFDRDGFALKRDLILLQFVGFLKFTLKFSSSKSAANFSAISRSFCSCSEAFFIGRKVLSTLILFRFHSLPTTVDPIPMEMRKRKSNVLLEKSSYK